MRISRFQISSEAPSSTDVRAFARNVSFFLYRFRSWKILCFRVFDCTTDIVNVSSLIHRLTQVKCLSLLALYQLYHTHICHFIMAFNVLTTVEKSLSSRYLRKQSKLVCSYPRRRGRCETITMRKKALKKSVQYLLYWSD